MQREEFWHICCCIIIREGTTAPSTHLTKSQWKKAAKTSVPPTYRASGAQQATIASQGSVFPTAWDVCTHRKRCVQQMWQAFSTASCSVLFYISDAIRASIGLETIKLCHLPEPSKTSYSFLTKDKQFQVQSLPQVCVRSPHGVQWAFCRYNSITVCNTDFSSPMVTQDF
jgi:hypothetical protein